MSADGPLTRRRPARRGMAPLRRKPKRLDSPPTEFAPAGGGAGPVLRARPATRRTAGWAMPGSAAAGTTDEEAALVGDVALDAELDPATLRRAREIAARLALPRPRRDVVAVRGRGAPASVPYDGGGDDIDLDATLESLAAHPVPEDEDVIVRERRRTARAVVLAVDVSGSMRGERVRTAAATVGALVGELAGDELAVLAFWSDAAVLWPLARPPGAGRLLDVLLRIPARGLTNVAFPLQLARRQLAGAGVRDARVLLLSDCVHNAGPDPRPLAAALPRVDVLADLSGEHDLDLARDLARLGRGRLATVRTHRDVPPALTRLFT